MFYITACKDSLPNKMTSNSNCKKLKKTCSKLKSKCSSKLGNALGSSNNAAKCKTALGSKKNTKVKVYCPITCGTCGKLLFQIGRNYKLYNIIAVRLEFVLIFL